MEFSGENYRDRLTFEIRNKNKNTAHGVCVTQNKNNYFYLDVVSITEAAAFSLQNNAKPIRKARDGIHLKLLADENRSIDS